MKRANITLLTALILALLILPLAAVPVAAQQTLPVPAKPAANTGDPPTSNCIPWQGTILFSQSIWLTGEGRDILKCTYWRNFYTYSWGSFCVLSNPPYPVIRVKLLKHPRRVRCVYEINPQWRSAPGGS